MYNLRVLSFNRVYSQQLLKYCSSIPVWGPISEFKNRRQKWRRLILVLMQNFWPWCNNKTVSCSRLHPSSGTDQATWSCQETYLCKEAVRFLCFPVSVSPLCYPWWGHFLWFLMQECYLSDLIFENPRIRVQYAETPGNCIVSQKFWLLRLLHIVSRSWLQREIPSNIDVLCLDSSYLAVIPTIALGNVEQLYSFASGWWQDNFADDEELYLLSYKKECLLWLLTIWTSQYQACLNDLLAKGFNQW